MKTPRTPALESDIHVSLPAEPQVCTRTETPASSLFCGTGSLSFCLLKVHSPCSKAFQSRIKPQTAYWNSQEEKRQEISQVIRNSSLQFPPPFHTTQIKNSSNPITEKDWVVFSSPFYSYCKRNRAHFCTKRFLSFSRQTTEFKDNSDTSGPYGSLHFGCSSVVWRPKILFQHLPWLEF